MPPAHEPLSGQRHRHGDSAPELPHGPDASAAACAAAAGARGTGLAVPTGGAFQNRRPLDRAAARLREAGLSVLVPRRLPAEDGGIAPGQSAVAAAGEAAA
jgi:hydrogenase maturation protein HypF